MSTQKVVIIGIDGFDPGLLERAMREGRAPHCTAIAKTGSFRKLATTNPAQSPVAWASLATGTNPGKHGLFDFLRRDANTYLPQLAILDVNRNNLLGKRSAMFRPVLHGEPFWNVTSKAGVATTVLKWPVHFPAGQVRGTALAGLGVPDIRMSLGRYTLYTTETTSVQDAKGDIIHLAPNKNHWETHLKGPNKTHLPVIVATEHGDGNVRLTLHGKDYDLAPGVWSPWLQVAFPHLLGQRITGMCRWYVASVSPLKLYVTSLHVDPRKPAFPISYPESFASELAGHIGPFHTLGLPEETNGVVDDQLPYDGFLSFVNDIQSERERIFWQTFAAYREGVFAFVFDTIDRVQHIFWMTHDAEHPLAGQEGHDRFATAISTFYERMDAFLGKLCGRLDDDTLLFVVSDHGFNTFRRAVHLNAWLREQGYLVLKDGPVGQPLFANVDWRQTRAYALGFSGIYLNRHGREGQGVVQEGEGEQLMTEMTKKLRALTDPQHGTPALQAVYRAADIYRGPYVAEAPDLVIGFAQGYRASWQTTVGATPADVFEDNRKKWSGDHLIDPSFVPGVFLANQPMAAEAPTVYDLAPTVLDALGLSAPAEMEGRSLLQHGASRSSKDTRSNVADRSTVRTETGSFFVA